MIKRDGSHLQKTHTHIYTKAVLLVKESRINAPLELWILSELCRRQNFSQRWPRILNLSILDQNRMFIFRTCPTSVFN